MTAAKINEYIGVLRGRLVEAYDMRHQLAGTSLEIAARQYQNGLIELVAGLERIAVIPPQMARTKTMTIIAEPADIPVPDRPLGSRGTQDLNVTIGPWKSLTE